MTSISRSPRRLNGWKTVVGALGVAVVALGWAPAGAAPATVPGAPTITSVTAAIQSVKVAFHHGVNGGASIVSYKATCASTDGGVTRSDTKSRSPIRVRHLTAGKTYTCTVAARNKVGVGPASAASASFVPLAPPVVTVPGAPTITSVKPATHKIKIGFAKPASDGGARVVNYKATCTSSDGGVLRSHNGSRSPIVVDHLTEAKTYTCTVAAKNRAGFGAASAASSAVIVLPNPPLTVPGAPTITSVTNKKHHALKVAFRRPASNGGTRITRYHVVCTSSDGGVARSRNVEHSPVTLSKLTIGKTYTCTVAARNKIGLGPASAPSSAVFIKLS